MNATKFRLGTPMYNGDLDFYYLYIDYRWFDVLGFFTSVDRGNSTFSQYKNFVRVLSELSTETDNQQTVLIGDYSYTEDDMIRHGWLIPQWAGLIGKTITKARSDSTPFVDFIELVNPIISAMRRTQTIYYDVDGNQTVSTADNILITVEIHGFRLDTDGMIRSYPYRYTMQGEVKVVNIMSNNNDTWRIDAITVPLANVDSFSEGNYVTCEFYEFEKLISGIASSITADISKRFVQR